MKAQVLAAFAVEELQINIEKNASLSDAKKMINDRNRLKAAKAFSALSDNALDFIRASCPDDATFEVLCTSDNKDAICNYKTALRIGQLGCILSGNNTVESVKNAFKAFKTLKSSQIDYYTLSSVLHVSNDSFADNVTRALYFFGFIKPLKNVELRKNPRFIHKMNKKNGITFEIIKSQ